MEIEIEDKGDYSLVRLDGRFVASCSEELKEQVGKALEKRPNVLFDLEKMTHIDSSGLGALVSVLQKTKSLGGTTRLACLQPHPRIVFDITKVFRVFEIFDDLESAMKSFEG